MRHKIQMTAHRFPHDGNIFYEPFFVNASGSDVIRIFSLINKFFSSHDHWEKQTSVELISLLKIPSVIRSSDAQKFMTLHGCKKEAGTLWAGEALVGAGLWSGILPGFGLVFGTLV